MKTKNGVCGYKAGNPVCCSHYHLINGTCDECTDGYFGRYCTPCTYPSYGYLCRLTCDCSQRLCHIKQGCPKSTMQSTAHTLVQSTISSTIATTETRPMMTERSSLMLTTNTKAWTVGSLSSTYLAMTSLEVIRTSGSMGVPPDHTSQTSVIIIIGSFVCFFLVLIIGIQIHSKFQKQKSLISERKNGGKHANLYDFEDTYDEIEDEHVSIVTKKYDIIANRSESNYTSPKFIDTDANFVPTCSSSNLYLDVIKDDNPEISDSLQNSCEPLSRPELSTFDDSKQNECEPVHESHSSPTDIRAETYLQNPIDTDYLEPMGLMDISETIPDLSLQHSTYLDVVFK